MKCMHAIYLLYRKYIIIKKKNRMLIKSRSTPCHDPLMNGGTTDTNRGEEKWVFRETLRFITLTL